MARKKKAHVFSPNIVITIVLVVAVIVFVGFFASRNQKQEIPASVLQQNNQNTLAFPCPRGCVRMPAGYCRCSEVAVFPNDGIDYEQSASLLIKYGDTSPLVSDVKKKLGQLGYGTGGLLVNDYFNARLQNAIIKFQLIEDLSPTGAIDTTTLNRIYLRTTK